MFCHAHTHMYCLFANQCLLFIWSVTFTFSWRQVALRLYEVILVSISELLLIQKYTLADVV